MALFGKISAAGVDVSETCNDLNNTVNKIQYILNIIKK